MRIIQHLPQRLNPLNGLQGLKGKSYIEYRLAKTIQTQMMSQPILNLDSVKVFVNKGSGFFFSVFVIAALFI